MEKTLKTCLILVCLVVLIVIISCESSNSYRTCGVCGEAMTKTYDSADRVEWRCFACDARAYPTVKCPTCNKNVTGQKGTKEKCKNCGTLVPMP